MLVSLVIILLVLAVHEVAGFIVAKPLSLSLSSSSSSIRNINKLNAIENIVTIDPSYSLGLGSAALGLTFCNIGNIDAIKNASGINIPGKILGGLTFWFLIFAAFFSFQATTLRFQFDESSFSLVKASGEKLGDNVVVGGENKWDYKTFVNWAFLPSEDFPILVYFKETQTPREKWIEAPIVVDDAEGQVHFFPAISRVDQLKEQFQKNKCTKLEDSKIIRTQMAGSVL